MSTASDSLELIVEVGEGPRVAPGRGPRTGPRDLVHDVGGGGGVCRGGVVEPAEVVSHHAAVGTQLHWGATLCWRVLKHVGYQLTLNPITKP